MVYVNIFRDLFESIEDYRKILELLFLIKNQIGFLKDDIDYLREEYKNKSFDKIEEHVEYIKDREESIIEKILNK